LNKKERFTLAERIQKRIQEKNPYFQLIKKRDEIEKEFEMRDERLINKVKRI
jgi:hypothetical protein